MSYCRCGNDSDVYVYASGNGFSCHVAWREAFLKDVPDSLFVPFTAPAGTAEKAIVGHLLWLARKGIKVPNRALLRLFEEIDELSAGTNMTQEEYDDHIAAQANLEATMAAALEVHNATQE